MPGYTDLTGNDLADKLAKSAATLASNGDFRSTLSLTEAKNSLKSKAVNRWKNRIERTLNNHQHLPQPSTKSFKSSMSRIAETRFHRLVLNHTLLRIHRSKMFPEQYPSPDCECGTDVQSIDHYLLNCPLIENQITSLVNSIDAGFVKTSPRPISNSSIGQFCFAKTTTSNRT